MQESVGSWQDGRGRPLCLPSLQQGVQVGSRQSAVGSIPLPGGAGVGCAFVSLCLCALLCTPAFSAEIDLGMGLGIEPQAMVIVNVPLNTMATPSSMQSTIDLIPNQTAHGFLNMQNNTTDDAAVQLVVMPGNMPDNAPAFIINPTNLLLPAFSFRAVEYTISPALITNKWNIYAAARFGTQTTTTTIMEITGHILGTDSSTGELPVSEEHPRHILATVFHDRDGDGNFSPDEKGMEGVVLYSKNQTATTTATGQAIFSFSSFMPGTQGISLDISTVPIEYVCAVPIEQTVVVAEGDFVWLKFPLQLSGRIEGVVFIDENRNGLFDPGEQGVRDAIISANDGITITSLDGRYKFSSMLSGRYSLKLKMGSITDAGYEGYEPTTPEILDVTLQQGQRLNRINFGIAGREKEIEFE